MLVRHDLMSLIKAMLRRVSIDDAEFALNQIVLPVVIVIGT